MIDSSPFSLKRKGDGIAASPFYLKGHEYGVHTSPFSLKENGHGNHLSILSKGDMDGHLSQKGNGDAIIS